MQVENFALQTHEMFVLLSGRKREKLQCSKKGMDEGEGWRLLCDICKHSQFSIKFTYAQK
jgi:hypothetical protein